MASARRMVWQVREDFPSVAYGRMSGSVAHAIVSRLEAPAKWCTAACGWQGFVDDDAEDGALVCMRCDDALREAR